MFDREGAAGLEGLNDEQRRAATSGAPSLLVIAGAGSGKTRTLAARVAHLVAGGVPPERILLLTFTRRAARVMIRRAERLGGQGTSRVWGGTFHSVANRLLRAHGRALGVPPGFTVLDAADGADLIGLVRSDLGLGERGRRFPRAETLAAIYSRAVNARAALVDVVETWFPWCGDDVEDIKEVFRGYVARKAAGWVLDFDDLLLYWLALMGRPRAAEEIRALFDHILVDEYQDTNSLQAEVLGLMRSASNSITVVGDDAQAIYSFRAATVRNILEFPARHPGTEIVALERNYRSTRPILDAANAVMAQARGGYDKRLWSTIAGEAKPTLLTCGDEREQCDALCERILGHREEGMALSAQAVLFRASHHSAMLEVELVRRNIPFVKYGGLRFMEAAHVKDVLAWLRLLENPFDELSWFRALQLLDGVGPATARRIMTELGIDGGGARDGGARSPLHRLLSEPPRVPAASEQDLRSWAEAASECLAGMPPAAQVERARRFYEPVCERRYDAPTSRLGDIEQLARIAAGFPSLGHFLGELTLDPPASTADLAGRPLLDDDYLVLSTIHSAKGCEWDAVHVISAVDGMIPSDMALSTEEGEEEERRLLYVAMTRARRALHVYFPLRMYHRRAGIADAHGYGQLTRFLPPSCHGLFDLASAGAACHEDEPGSDALAPVRAMLERLWA